MKEKLILIGGGGHCKSCIDVIEKEDVFEIKGILDIKEKVGQKVLGYLILGTDGQIERLAEEKCHFLITLGQLKSADLRENLYNKLKKIDAKIATIISPLAHVSKYAKIGEGSIIMHNAILNAGAVVGQNCIINTKALIEHDVKIGDNCHISTASVVNGEAIIGQKSFVGSNATIVNCAKVSENSFVKAGSLVK